MIEDRNRLKPSPKKTGKQRRPRSLRGPKLVAYCSGCGTRFDPKPVPKWQKPFLEYGFRPVILRRFPNRNDLYYAYAPEAPASALSGGMTRTHRMMQSIICDTRFVQCRVAGAVFSADLDEPTPERTRPGDIAAARGVRRPDITAKCRKSNHTQLHDGPLDVEIAVTNPVSDFDRYLDLVKGGRPCLEVLVPRSRAMEDDVEKLEHDLRAKLLAAEFEARWIVDPNGVAGTMHQLADIATTVETQRTEAQGEIHRLSDEIDQHERSRECSLKALKPTEKQRELLDEYARANAEFGALVRTLDAAHPERPSLFRKLVEVIIPELRTERLKTQAQRIAYIKLQMDSNSYRRSGLDKRVTALLRAEERAKAIATEARDLEQKIALKNGKRAEQLERVADHCAALRIVAALRTRGVQMIFRPHGHTVRSILAFEYDRWC